MSFTELTKGTVVLIADDVNDNIVNLICQKYYEDHYGEAKHTDWLEACNDKYYENSSNPYFIYKNEKLYKVINTSTKEADEYFIVKIPHDNATFDFVTQYYNGGCGWQEMLDDIL